MLLSITNYVYGFNIITVGDVDCKSTAKELVNDIVKKLADFYLWLGDLSYTETPEGDECFLDMLKNKEILDKSYIVLGNHDLLNEKDYLNTFNLTKSYYSIDFNYKIKDYKNTGIQNEYYTMTTFIAAGWEQMGDAKSTGVYTLKLGEQQIYEYG